ncbi:hypothetical protein BESB_060150 [Besnoitia besnoiti]|uniref:Transmembrane protein n=1 Tax=Besnoitia besnoiti TaxID=94643 RepID=A0A2A9M9H4_BESBE|nr:hypothetical protein BESB_060150 [Besnoitia besnoiti]PFH35128.1 hypothetical protein BESB_060150 [Besnoitia besnoiti]
MLASVPRQGCQGPQPAPLAGLRRAGSVPRFAAMRATVAAVSVLVFFSCTPASAGVAPSNGDSSFVQPSVPVSSSERELKRKVRELLLEGPAMQARTRKLVEIGRRLNFDGLVLDLTAAQPRSQADAAALSDKEVQDVVKSYFQKFAIDAERRAMHELREEDPELAANLKSANVAAEVKHLVASRLSEIEVVSPSKQVTDALTQVAEFFRDIKANREKFVKMVHQKFDFETPIAFDKALAEADEKAAIEAAIEIARDETRRRLERVIDDISAEERMAMASLGLSMAHLEESLLERMVNPYRAARGETRQQSEQLRAVVADAQAQMKKERLEEHTSDAESFASAGLLPAPPAFLAQMPMRHKAAVVVLLAAAAAALAVGGKVYKIHKARAKQRRRAAEDALLELNLEELVAAPLKKTGRSSQRRRLRSSRLRRLERTRSRFVDAPAGPSLEEDTFADSMEDEDLSEVLERVPVGRSQNRR